MDKGAGDEGEGDGEGDEVEGVEVEGDEVEGGGPGSEVVEAPEELELGKRTGIDTECLAGAVSLSMGWTTAIL